MKRLVYTAIMLLAAILFCQCEKDDEKDNGNNKFTGDSGIFTDPRDDREYEWVRIGDQIWMAENLTATQLNDGSAIPLVEDGEAWMNAGLSASPAYCWYQHDEENYRDDFGALYNWYTVATGKLCPEGWHVPSDQDWKVLTDYLGGEDVAAGKMKATGTEYWMDPNTAATNESGFTALPGGSRSPDGDGFFGMGEYAAFLTSNPEDADLPWRLLYYDTGEMVRDYDPESAAFSVRCLRDQQE